MDDAFRRQLETAEKSHREELAKVTEEKQREVTLAEQRVSLLWWGQCLGLGSLYSVDALINPHVLINLTSMIRLYSICVCEHDNG